ncbi:FecCD family ABC transporter permease [Cryptosporangium minutisporangium]|uniref:Iron chelate uptake ABC transporter family permease subunit n=1 Tax=Cryptosporangium minutisporangium TaxID=113569 RepID=A0ABP6T498_9ACTN
MRVEPEFAAPARPPEARPRVHVLRAIGLLIAAAALALVCLLSVWVGTKQVGFLAVWDLLRHNDGSSDALIVHDLRIPRTMLGVLVGAALGLAGALMQSLTRNPLAEPGVLGVNLGASAAVVVAIAFLSIESVLGYVWFAFAGAAVASVFVYVLGSSGRSTASPDRMVLAGAAVTAVLGAFTWAVQYLNPGAFDEFRFWQVGSLSGRSTTVVWQVAPFILIGIVLALSLGRSLNVLALGDDTGRALGAHLGRIRVLVAIAVMLLCGGATAAAGPILFLGLAVPYAARLLVGADQRWVLPYSMLLSPILLLGSDLVGRLVIAPAEMQVGVVTAFLGAPMFIALCRRRRLASL